MKHMYNKNCLSPAMERDKRVQVTLYHLVITRCSNNALYHNKRNEVTHSPQANESILRTCGVGGKGKYHVKIELYCYYLMCVCVFFLIFFMFDMIFDVVLKYKIYKVIITNIYSLCILLLANIYIYII